MAALTDERAVRIKQFSRKDLQAAADTYYKNAIVCLDPATGLVVAGQQDTGLVPIGLVSETKTLTAPGKISVHLFREVTAIWCANDTTDPVLATHVGNVAYLVDDQTVSSSHNSNTRSVFGLVWEVSPTGAVLVEPLHTAV